MTDLQNYAFPSLKLNTNDGILQSYNLVADLINPFFDSNLEVQENYCKNSLETFKENGEKFTNPNETKYNSRNKNIKRGADRKTSTDLFAKLNSYTTNQLKNQTIRFGWEGADLNLGVPRPSWGFKGLMGGNQAPLNGDSREYEDVLSPDLLQAPICDLCIIQAGETVPDGFFRLYKSPQNKKANLNSGSGGNGIYLCIKKDLTGQIAPITNLIVLFPDRGENIPPGYHMVHRGTSACNINTGTGAERIYLCYKKDFLANPINDITLIFPAKGETPPKSFQLIDKSISGLNANLNLGTGGAEIFLTYRQDLIRLWCLLNEPDPEQEKLKRRYTRDEISFRRASITDGLIAAARSRSKSPVPSRGRFGSGANHELSVTAKHALLETPPPVFGSPTFNTHEIEETISKVKFAERVTSVDSKTDEIQEIDQLESMDEWPDLPEEMLNPKEMEQATLRKTQEVVDANGEKVPRKQKKALLAILSALYTRHGSLWDIALSGLVKLFKDTDFYEKDLMHLPLPATLTMLDVTIEAVCDRFDLSPESDHNKLLEFLRIIIKHSGARLASFSLQRMFKAISYVCSIQATKANWIHQGASMPCNDPSLEITPFRVLKQLVWDTVAQVETAEVAQFLPDSDYFEASLDSENQSPLYYDIRIIVEDLIDDVTDSVEVSRICEAVMLTISKQSLTTNASAFWHSINSFSRKLFSDAQLRSAFVTLCALAKQAWHGIRKAKNGDYIPRDIGTKLVALEALMEFCFCAGEKMRISKVMGYSIRRIIVPCIMYNITYALCDHRIFSKLLKIITALWKNWRRHIRIEFAILCEQLIFKVLQASVIQIRPIYQYIVIQEVQNWFEQPHVLIEMFVNYDMDRKFVSHWNTFSYLVRSMCAIGRRLSLVTSAWDWKPGGVNAQAEEANRVTVTIRDVHLQALHEVSRMAKTLMDASGHAFLIIQDSEFRNRSLGENAGWVEDEDSSMNKSGDTADTAETGNGAVVSPNGTPLVKRPRAGSVKIRRAAHQEAEELIQQAIKIYTDKQSLKKAVEFLLSKGFMPDTPQEIANFLRVYKNSFDPSAIGDFLGEGGANPLDEEYWSQIRFRYTRAVSFVEMEIEPALRLYLTGCGFRLPGEAQKIDRFVEVFVKAFWQDNSGTQYCPFRHPDTIHLLSYAIIMLNTDLHRANTDKKKNKKMTKDEFINNLRGADQGTDINRDLLQSTYDSILAQPIELAVKATNANGSEASSSKEFEEMLKKDGRTSADDMVNSVLSQNNKTQNDIRMIEEKKFIRDLGQTLRDSEDLLRSLSPFTYRFHLTNIDTKISLDLVSYMFETVWYHFHAIVEAIFNASSTDMDIKFAALDVLCYSLTSAIFLNLKVERMAFATLLSKFRKTCEALPHIINSDRPIPDDSWYEDVENANEKNTMEIIAKLHHLTVHIKDTIQEATNYEITRQVANKFEKRARILENNLYFIRQGDLMKLSRTGKNQSYKFFLFSDHLIYAHMNMKKEYVVHEQLSLSALSVSDIETDTSFTSFYISHPIKSFVVIAESPVMKQQWIRDINAAIANCKKRETAQQDGPLNRRMSMITRIEDQQMKLEKEHQNVSQPSSANRGRRGSRINQANAGMIGHDATADADFINHSADDTDFQAIPFSNPASPTITTTKTFPPHAIHTSDDSLGDVREIVPFILPPDEVAHTLTSNDTVVSTPASTTLPTPEERAQKQQESKQNFETIVTTISEERLNTLFNAVS